MYDGCCNRGMGRLGGSLAKDIARAAAGTSWSEPPLEDITGTNGVDAGASGQGYKPVYLGPGMELNIPDWVPNILQQVFGAFGAKSTPPSLQQIQQKTQAGFDTGGLLLPAVVIAAAGIAAIAVWKSLK